MAALPLSLALFAAIIIIESSRLFARWFISHRLSNEAVPFSREDASLPHSLLILGDSTAYGTGASDPKHSIAGRIASAFPHYSVWNRSQNALSLAHLPSIIDAVAEEKKSFDSILVIIGGIDILRLTPLRTIRKNLLISIEKAKKLSPRIYIASSSNIRSASFFRFPMDRIFEIEHRTLENLYEEIAASEHITHIPLFSEISSCAFARDPEKLYAQDGLHPNDTGYELWFEKIAAVMKKIP